LAIKVKNPAPLDLPTNEQKVLENDGDAIKN